MAIFEIATVCQVLRGLRGQLRMGQEAERAYSIVRADEDKSLSRQRRPCRQKLGWLLAAMNPDHDRQFLSSLIFRQIRGPQVQIETVLVVSIGEIRVHCLDIRCCGA